MDVKKLGRIPDGGGWRLHGRAAGSTSRDRATKVGFDYVHSLVDEYSRLAYSEAPPTNAAPPAQHSCSARPATSPTTASPASNA
jgi:hypothetical protein